MERLRRYEIDAIMSRLKSKLNDKIATRRTKWIQNFEKTDPNYEKLANAAKEFEVAVNKMKTLSKELKLCGYYSADEYINAPKHYASRRCDDAIKRPDYKQIENDLVISTISADFDANEFINNILNEY